MLKRERERERDALNPRTMDARRKSTTDSILEEILSESDDPNGVLPTVEEVEFARVTLTQVEMQSSLRSLDTQVELRLKDLMVSDLLCGSKDPADCIILAACSPADSSKYGVDITDGQDDDAPLVSVQFNAFSKMSPSYARVGACLDMKARSLNVHLRIRVLSALLEMVSVADRPSDAPEDTSTEPLELGSPTAESDAGKVDQDGEGVVRTQMTLAFSKVNFYLQGDMQEAFAKVTLDQIQLGSSRFEDGVERWSGRLGNLVVMDLTLSEGMAFREMLGTYRPANDTRPLLLFETKVNQTSREEWIDEVNDQLAESGKDKDAENEDTDEDMQKSSSTESNLDALLESLLDESPPSSPNFVRSRGRRKNKGNAAMYKGLTGDDFQAFSSLPLPVIPFRRETRVEARLLRCRVCPSFLHKILNYMMDAEVMELLRSLTQTERQASAGKANMQFDSITVTLTKLQLEFLSLGISNKLTRVLSLEIENMFLTNAYFLADPQQQPKVATSPPSASKLIALSMHIFERVDLSVLNISLLVDNKEEGSTAIKSVDNLCINSKFASIVGKTGVTCHNSHLARRFKWRTEQLQEDRKVLEVRMPVVTFAINAYQVVGLMSLVEQFKDATVKAIELSSALSSLPPGKDEPEVDTDAVFLNIPDFDHASQEDMDRQKITHDQEQKQRSSHKFVLMADGFVLNLLNSAKDAKYGLLSLTFGNAQINMQRANGLEISLVNIETVEAQLLPQHDSSAGGMTILESQRTKESLLQFRYEQEDCFSKIYTRVSQPTITVYPSLVRYALNLYARIDQLGKSTCFLIRW